MKKLSELLVLKPCIKMFRRNILIQGLMHPLRAMSKRKRAFFMEGTLDLPAHPVM